MTRDVTAWASLTSPALAGRRCLVDSSRFCWQLLLRLGPPRLTQHKAAPCVAALHRRFMPTCLSASLAQQGGVAVSRLDGCGVSLRITSLSCGRSPRHRQQAGGLNDLLPDPFLESQLRLLRYRRFAKIAGSDRPHLREVFLLASRIRSPATALTRAAMGHFCPLVSGGLAVGRRPPPCPQFVASHGRCF